MGILIRQGSKNTIYLFIGVGLGFVSSALLQPRFLSPEENGVVKLLVAYSAILAQLFTLGFPSALIKFKSDFHERNINDIKTTLFYTGLGTALFLLLFFLVGKLVFSYLLNAQSVFWNYLHLLPLATVATLLFFNLDAFTRTELYSTPGTLSKEVGQRIFILLSLLALAGFGLPFSNFLNLYTLALAFPALALMVFLHQKQKWNWGGSGSLRTHPDFRRKIHSVSAYAIVSGLSVSFIISLDAIFIERFLGTASTGIYAVFGYFATLVLIPYRGIERIASPLISKALAENQMQKIKAVYLSSSKYLLYGAGVLLAILLSNRSNILAFLPSEYRIGLPILIWLGLSNLLDAATGINTAIIANSKYYRFNMVLLLGLIGMASALNIWLIPMWGLQGAAIATFCSVAAYNLSKLVFIGLRFHMWPWNFKTLAVVGIPALLFLLGEALPSLPNMYLDGMLRTACIAGLAGLALFIRPLFPGDWKL